MTQTKEPPKEVADEPTMSAVETQNWENQVPDWDADEDDENERLSEVSQKVEIGSALPICDFEARDLAELSLGALADEANRGHQASEQFQFAAARAAAYAGVALIKAKAQIKWGDWSYWLTQNFKGSPETARVYIRIAKYWPLVLHECKEPNRLSIREVVKLMSQSEPKRLEDFYKREKSWDGNQDFFRRQCIGRIAGGVTQWLQVRNTEVLQYLLLEKPNALRDAFDRILDELETERPGIGARSPRERKPVVRKWRRTRMREQAELAQGNCDRANRTKGTPKTTKRRLA